MAAANTFFFYDLETTGINPREARIMQFAGQRTDLDFNPVGDPVNLLVKLTPDIVPEPDAIMVTGITPQSTLQDGLTEVEFLQEFYDVVVKPGTIFLGFNTVRFDDEFMRYLHYRNYYDAYEWQWCDDCSRWDLLDLVRMTRALRPDGIEWPFTPEGKPTNRLELLTKLNGVAHEQAHDALSDVTATIAVAKLIKDKQPDLFKYLFESRTKQAVSKLLCSDQPFVYTSGRYAALPFSTTVAVRIGDAPYGSSYVYDLREDPAKFMALSDVELLDACRYSADKTKLRLPVKELKPNKCPAVAPLGVIKDQAVQARLELDLATVTKHFQKLKEQPEFYARIIKAFETVEAEKEPWPGSNQDVVNPQTVDALLYDGFVSKADKVVMSAIRAAKPAELADYANKLEDKRLRALLPIYKARNFPRSLSDSERPLWEAFIHKRLMDGGIKGSRLGKYFKRLEELAAEPDLSDNKQFLLEELQLYGQSLVPAAVDDGVEAEAEA